MSDSLPSDRGQVPYEARDLDDVVLSGDTARVPASRRQATAVMAALRAAPAPSELTGEAAARAAYRLFVLPDGGWPARAAADPLIAAEPVARPHSHRRVSRRRWPGGRPAAALLGVVAAAACVVAVVCAVTGPGGGPPGQTGQRTSDTHSPGTTGKQSVLEGGVKAQPPAPAATPAASSRAAATPAGPGAVPSGASLCQELQSLEHPGRSAERSAARNLEKQLGAKAGGMSQILGYCWTQLHQTPQSGGPGGSEPGSGDAPGEGGPFGQRVGVSAGQAGAASRSQR